MSTAKTLKFNVYNCMNVVAFGGNSLNVSLYSANQGGQNSLLSVENNSDRLGDNIPQVGLSYIWP